MDKLHKERCQLFDVEMLSNLHGKFIDYNDHWNDNKQICVLKRCDECDFIWIY